MKMKCVVAFALLGLFLGCTLQAVKSEERMQDEEEANDLLEMISPDEDFEDQNDELEDNDDDDDDDDGNYEENYGVDDELKNPR